jgi:hypothetical protein
VVAQPIDEGTNVAHGDHSGSIAAPYGPSLLLPLNGQRFMRGQPANDQLDLDWSWNGQGVIF